MTSQTLAAFISASGALLVAVTGYLFTKRAEREAAWRSEKLGHYKALLSSLNGIFAGQGTEEGQRAFARACNDLLLFAPRGVLSALARFQDEIRASNPNRSQAGHDRLLSELISAIREDLGVETRRERDPLAARLWVAAPSMGSWSGTAPEFSAGTEHTYPGAS